MADTYYMVNVTQSELEKFVCQNTSCIGKAKEGMIRENSAKAHSSRMQYSFVTQTAQTCMTMDNLYSLSEDNIAEDGKEGEDRGEGGLSVYD